MRGSDSWSCVRSSLLSLGIRLVAHFRTIKQSHGYIPERGCSKAGRRWTRGARRQSVPPAQSPSQQLTAPPVLSPGLRQRHPLALCTSLLQSAPPAQSLSQRQRPRLPPSQSLQLHPRPFHPIPSSSSENMGWQAGSPRFCTTYTYPTPTPKACRTTT